MRILIAEEALQSGSGHWPSYIGDIASGLRELGDQVDVLVHDKATDSVLQRTGGCRWFSRNCWIDPKSQGAVGGIKHNLIFAHELAKWLGTHNPYDWICALTMRLQHLLAFALLIRSSVVPRKTRLLLLFVQGFGIYAGAGKPTIFPKNASTQLARFCFWLLTPSVLSGRVLLAAETTGMQDELQRFTGLPVTLAPHPVGFSSQPLTSSFRSSSFPLTITCLGFARHEKGSDLLQEAIRILIARPDEARYRFVLQWPEPFAMPNGLILGPDQELISDSRVEFLNHNLNIAEYDALLARTDLIVLPYRRNSYHHRVSRVAIEAAGRGIPTVYMSGTWLEEVASLAGCGVSIAEEDAESVANAIINAVNKIEELRRNAEIGAWSVRAFHSVLTLRVCLKIPRMAGREK